LPLYRALQADGIFSRVVYISEQPLSEERRAQGWSSALLATDDIILAPSKIQVAEIISNAGNDAVHVFSGLRKVGCIVEGLRLCAAEARHFGVMHEPRVFDFGSGLLRLAQSWATEGDSRRHAKFVLAIGAHGPSWFKMSGYRAKIIFPYAYFIDQNRTPVAAGSSDGVTRIGYLGRLEKAKGAHLLKEAFAHLPDRFELRIAGAGSLAEDLKSLEAKHPGRVEFVGKIEMDRVNQFLDGLDLLVLPSITRDDGWGVVVSEALMRGLAVVVSEAAGASACLAMPSLLGRKVTANSAKAISAAILDISEKGECGDKSRTLRAAWAQDNLVASHGAEYMRNVIEFLLSSAPHPGKLLGDPPHRGQSVNL
jgi:glycosyltransferase involved in cell wall biosynthesis